MIISGLQKVTLLDYPEHIACTIFLGHCNLRCPFCHNMELVTNPEHFPTYTIQDIISFLKERKGRLNGVAITGGEPLLNTDIVDLLKPIKELGYPIKLDTNGFFPDMIEKLIDEKLVDKFAMDIKSGFTNYLKVCGINENAKIDNWQEHIKKSINLLMNKALDYEFRTTCVKNLHTDDDFYEIKEMIKGAKNYFLQDYKSAPDMEKLPFSPFSKDELMHFADIVRDSVENIEIRGI
ncbi:MAG: anaerobic ribonucleoside-triphosphate reductase activating protein [Lachnospiraceae bacterium]|nr:anaerobic ribonucleoside-triphosphate reductase activating protein [Lachnospiraceae bacterium]